MVVVSGGSDNGQVEFRVVRAGPTGTLKGGHRQYSLLVTIGTGGKSPGLQEEPQKRFPMILSTP